MILSLSRSAVLLLTAWATVSQAAPTHDTTLSWEEAYVKAKAVVDKMSLEQKVDLTTGMGWEKTLCVGQTYATEDPNLPSLCLQDSPLGVRFADNVTAGVSGITAAQSWDREAIYQRGVYMGQEFRGKGVNFQLGPCIDVYRSPRAGRGWEAFGEDPYLAGVATAETVQGIQSQGVIATAKHYIGNNQEHNRTLYSSNIDDRSFHEVWLWPYARAVEAGVGAIMCSYNRVNNTYSCQNEYTLNTVLKGELGFKGLVMSDWGATMSTVPSVKAGLDMTMPGDIVMGDGLSYFGANLTKAVKDGEITEERVTDMATRIAAAYFKMGQDKAFPEIAVNSFNRSAAPFVDVQADHGKLVREMGAAAVAILRNEDNVLPLGNSLKKIAIIGNDVGPNPRGLNPCQDQACPANSGTLAMGWGSGTADFPYLVTPKEGIENRAGNSIEITYTYDNYGLEKAAELAKDADVALVFGLADSGEDYLTVDGNEGDRKNLTLWNNADNLVRAVADANNNTVVVIHAVGPVMMPWADHPNVKAIVWPGLPGQESGNSLADVLFGDVNPSGRLTTTIAKKPEDYGADINETLEIDYTERLLVGYKWFDAKGIEPLFPFGHGLSYTTFNYSQLNVKSYGSKGRNGVLATASIVIKNTGNRDGAEIPQAYISFPESAGEPPKSLRGFEKVFIKAGRQTKVTFEFGETELSIWDVEKAAWVVPEGEFIVQIGASSRDIRASANFTIA